MARRPAETVSVLTYRTGLHDANIAGNVHGGYIMKLCDDAAVIAAMRLAGGRVVTAAVDAMQFRSPVRVGDLITLRSQVNAAWRTSMEIGVRIEAENVVTGEIPTPARPTSRWSRSARTASRCRCRCSNPRRRTSCAATARRSGGGSIRLSDPDASLHISALTDR